MDSQTQPLAFAEENLEAMVGEAANADNEEILKKYLAVSEKYFKKSRRHLFVGHKKDFRDLQVAKILLNRFMYGKDKKRRDAEIVYWDNRGTLPRMLDGLKYVFGRREIPEGLSVTSAPEGTFESASCFLTLHEFGGLSQIYDASKKIVDMLNEGGRMAVIDYSMPYIMRIEDIQKRRAAFARIFSYDFEKEVLEKEPDAVEAHTRYSLAICQEHMNTLGMKEILSSQDDNKFFFYIGEKPKKQ